MSETEHTVLVAFTVYGHDHRDAMATLVPLLPSVDEIPEETVTSWWFAEDDRIDGSDTDSAIFVPPGEAWRISTALAVLGLTPNCNIVTYSAWPPERVDVGTYHAASAEIGE